MRHLGGIAAAACALALACSCALAGSLPVAAPGDRAPGTATGTAIGTAAARPALWRTYDMLVNLQKLPRTYTCDQLWYEFHGILLRLGAWPYSLNILPYHCSPSPSGGLRSPDVQVRFQLPIFLPAAGAQWAPARAIERTLRLSPGEPKTLHPSDCVLMQQISRTLLASLPMRIDEAHFDCSASGRRGARFDVRVSLPMAVKKPTSAAASAARGPH